MGSWEGYMFLDIILSVRVGVRVGLKKNEEG